MPAGISTSLISTTLTFSVQSAPRGEIPFSYALIPAAMSLARGELSEPAQVSGGALLVYMADRQPGDTLAAERIKPQLRDRLARRRTGALVTDWSRWNLAQMGFEPKNAPVVAAAGGDEDAE